MHGGVLLLAGTLAAWTASVAGPVAAGPPASGDATRAPRIANGVLSFDHPSAGALLCQTDPLDFCLPESGDAYGIGPAIQACSGTLLGCRTFLTAAHCVCHGGGTFCNQTKPRDPAKHLVFLQHAGVFPVTAVHVHPDFNFSFRPWLHDVAVLELGEPVTGIRPSAINQTGTPPLGTPGTIVGFGRSSPALTDWGLKREGSVETGACDRPGAEVCWTFEEPLGPPGTDSAPCFGDSGGPLLVDLGAGLVVAGATWGGAPECTPPQVNVDADVFAQRDFIAAVAGADLGKTCGAFPAVGETGTEDAGFSGAVSAGKPEGRHSFDVDAGSSALRVVLNADDGGFGEIDFDLYVKAGAPPTTSDYDCRAPSGAGTQYEACEIPAPADGTWHALVQQVSGGGVYQLTVVSVPEPGRALLTLAAALLVAARALLGARHRA